VEEVSLEICKPYDWDLPGKTREDDSSGGHDNEDDPKQLVRVRGQWSRSAVTNNSVTGHLVTTLTQDEQHSCWLVLIVTRCHEHCSASRQLLQDVPKGPVTSVCGALILGWGRHHGRKDGDRVGRRPNRGSCGKGLDRIKKHGGSAALWVIDWVSGQMLDRAKLECEGKARKYDERRNKDRSLYV
jgi:hypothetical protein